MLHKLSGRRRWFSVLPLLLALVACGESPAEQEAQAKNAAYREKYAKAKALFEERCKTAGVVVRRTVKDVEGLELLKVRPKLEWGDRRYFDPMFSGAAMAFDGGGDEYIRKFLFSEFRATSSPSVRGQLAIPNWQPNSAQLLKPIDGYRYVEYFGPNENKAYRITLDASKEAVLLRETIDRITTRYALDYEDLVVPGDRAVWIAGTKLKVLDKQTGEVIAELTRYVWDSGFGGGGTGRWPWQHASSGASTVCPSDSSRPTGADTRYFVDEILIPRQGK